jgi:hypothetical protein
MLGRVLLALGIGGVFASCFGGEISFESKPARTHLIELFTSEGCSSCPPAEAWLNALQSNPRLWIDFVPVAFHVTYWDNTAWRDPFASKEWTSRQYAYSALWNSNSVYTPAFVLDGREWMNHALPPSGGEIAGVLKAVVTDGDKAILTFSPVPNDSRVYEVHVAQLGFGLEINVKAGENGGRKLVHDFVVLSLANARLNGSSAQVDLAKASAGSRRAIAAWVTEVGSMTPIQAIGGWLPSKN